MEIKDLHKAEVMELVRQLSRLCMENSYEDARNAVCLLAAFMCDASADRDFARNQIVDIIDLIMEKAKTSNAMERAVQSAKRDNPDL